MTYLEEIVSLGLKQVIQVISQIWKSDGSLVIINGAEESGYVIKGDDSGNEIEYYVKPKDDGSPTFIYDDELIICTNTGCY